MQVLIGRFGNPCIPRILRSFQSQSAIEQLGVGPRSLMAPKKPVVVTCHQAAMSPLGSEAMSCCVPKALVRVCVYVCVRERPLEKGKAKGIDQPAGNE